MTRILLPENKRYFKANVPTDFDKQSFVRFKKESKTQSHNSICKKFGLSELPTDIGPIDQAHANRNAHLWSKETVATAFILGDGHVSNTSYKGGLNVIRIYHGHKQYGFVLWKHEICKSLGLVSCKAPSRQLNFSETRRIISFSYCFKTNSCFKNLRKDFYEITPPGTQKILPPNFEEVFNDQILAIWLMDNGGLTGTSKYGMRLDVSAFGSYDRYRIAKIINEHYGVDVSFPQGEGKTQKMFFKQKNISNIINRILEPYFIPSMRYKIPG